jgi:hypothetical protein
MLCEKIRSSLKDFRLEANQAKANGQALFWTSLSSGTDSSQELEPQFHQSGPKGLID